MFIDFVHILWSLFCLWVKILVDGFGPREIYVDGFGLRDICIGFGLGDISTTGDYDTTT